jgi:hypothetical protein
MSGLILTGLGRGISEAGTSVGNAMMRKMELDEAAALRAKEKEDERALRLELAGMRNSSSSSSSRGSGGGMGIEDIGEGGTAEGMVARSMGVDVPTLRALRQGSETGDWSSFKKPKEDPDVGPVQYELPDGFEKYRDAKIKALSRVEQMFAMGKDFKDAAAGEQTAMETDLGRGIIGGQVDPTKAGQATAVMKGVAPFGGDSNVTRNVLTGEAATTEVGRSAITENNAQAGRASAEAGKARADTNRITSRTDPDTVRRLNDLTSRERTLRTQIGRLTSDVIIANNIRRGQPPAEYTEMLSELDDIKSERERLSGRPANSSPPPAPKGDNAPQRDPGKIAEPKSQAEFNALPKGTRFRAPDGSVRIKP